MTTLKGCRLGDVVELYYDQTSKRIVSHKTKKKTIKLIVIGMVERYILVGWKRNQPCSMSGFKISDQTIKHPGYTYMDQLEENGFTYACWISSKTEIKGKISDYLE